MSMPLTLGQLRRIHTSLVPKLLIKMQERGYEPSLDEGFVGRSIDKPSEDTPHRRDGGHLRGTAIDINLHKCPHVPVHFPPCPKPDYITSSEAHRPFGEYWITLHPLCRWSPSDGNHYGLLHGGVFLLPEDDDP